MITGLTKADSVACEKKYYGYGDDHRDETLSNWNDLSSDINSFLSLAYLN